MFKRFKQVAAVAAVVVAAGLAPARPASAGVAPVTITLDALLEGGQNQNGITVGDKLYSNFSFSPSGQVTLAADQIEVIFAEEGNSQFLAFLMDLSASGLGRSDVVIEYDVTVLDPARRIESVGLLFDGVPFGDDGRAAASVTETVSTLDGSDLVPGGPVQSAEIITVFNDGEGEGSLEDNFERTLAINPTRGLHFIKDILVTSREGSDGAGITVVENSVTQNGTGTVIPLPAAFWASIPVFGALVAGKKVRKLARRN